MKPPSVTIWKFVHQNMESVALYFALILPTTLCALPFFIGLCNVSTVKISPERHQKRRLGAGAEFLVDDRNKEGQQDGGPLTAKVQAITESKSIIFVFYHLMGVALCKLYCPNVVKHPSLNYPHKWMQLYNGIYVVTWALPSDWCLVPWELCASRQKLLPSFLQLENM